MNAGIYNSVRIITNNKVKRELNKKILTTTEELIFRKCKQNTNIKTNTNNYYIKQQAANVQHNVLHKNVFTPNDN